MDDRQLVQVPCDTNTGDQQQFWSERWSRYRFQAILIGCFLLWTPLLVNETLQIQHSCHPMVLFSKELPAECRQSSLTPSWFRPSIPSPTLQKSNTYVPSEPSNQGYSDLIGGTAGIAGAAALAIGGAPVTLAVGVGILLWLAVRTIF